MTLVPIPTNEYINGLSPVLKVRQTIDSRALPNLLAFAKAFYAALGIRLDITEASRSRPRQDYLWDLWQAFLRRGKRPPVASLAAPPYTSIHDEIKHGNATDLGSGIATFGTKAQQWATIHGPEYGVIPTGLEFSSPEPWHFEVALTTTAGSKTTRLDDSDSQPQPFYRKKKTMLIALIINDGKGAFGPAGKTRTYITGPGYWLETTDHPTANAASVLVAGYGPDGKVNDSLNLTYKELLDYAIASKSFSEAQLAPFRAAAK